MKLEVGRVYKRRDGNLCEIIACDKNDIDYPFKSNEGNWYTKYGGYYFDDTLSDHDLVEEIETVCKPPVGVITETDFVNPSHYKQYSVECIEVAEEFSFCLGNALKYIWRAGYKEDAILDLEKAKWYIEREIKRLNEQK
jgi:hypothetical protein